jgi:glutathione peroxidase
VDFPLASKEQVVGGDAHPFYKWAIAELGQDAAPKWNFHKYHVGRDGQMLPSFSGRVEPDAAELVEAVSAS